MRTVKRQRLFKQKFGVEDKENTTKRSFLQCCLFNYSFIYKIKNTKLSGIIQYLYKQFVTVETKKEVVDSGSQTVRSETKLDFSYAK